MANNIRGCICVLCIYGEKDFRRNENIIWCSLKGKYQREYHFCDLGVKKSK